MTSRAPPPRVAPLLHDGVRYEPDPATSGCLAALDAASGTRLWTVTLWTIVHDPDAPPHPGRYFGRIALAPNRHDLLVEDEHGARFLVDRARRAARPWTAADDLAPDGR